MQGLLPEMGAEKEEGEGMKSYETHVSKQDCKVECNDCGYEYYGRNGLGVAANHAKHHGHYVFVEVSRCVVFKPKALKEGE